MEEFLKVLLSTLDCIEVKGKDNLDRLLGCMLELEAKINELNEEKTNTEGGEQANG